MSLPLPDRLRDFASSRNFLGKKGALCVALVVTRTAKSTGLPIDAGQLVTDAKGQVLGLGRTAVQSILAEHGITKILAAEGGRTNRGSLGQMQEYVAFLNDLQMTSDFNIDAVEAWWVARVNDYLAAAPLRLKVDPGSSIKTCLQALFDEVKRRQAAVRGATMLGSVMQHLVGAKLEVLFPDAEIPHSGSSVADAPTRRSGDYQIGDTVIHVTTAPGSALIQKCHVNLDQGMRPLIITTAGGVTMTESLADESGISRRVEVLDITHFLVTNVLEWSGFDVARRRHTFEELIARYNVIGESCETDPGLRIEVG